MAKGGTQISSLHLAMAAGGGVLIYAALTDLSPLEALKEITSGKKPQPVEEQTSNLIGRSLIPGVGGALGGGFGGEGTVAGGGGSALVSAAERYIGVPYKWGGTTSRGVDCSGLVVLAFQDAYGVTPPRTTYTQEPWKELSSVKRGDLSPGDLVFWNGHVAIYAGGGEVIHAPGTGKKVKRAPIDQSGPVGLNPSSYKRYKKAGGKDQDNSAAPKFNSGGGGGNLMEV